MRFDQSCRGTSSHNRNGLSENPPARSWTGERPARAMQAQSKRRSAQQRSPPGVSSRAAFDVRRAQAVSMMVQVGGLDCVHRAHHANAQREHREVGGPPAQTKGIVVGVVNLAESGQEKEECARERHDRKCLVAGRCEMRRRQRSGKPRRGDQRFIDHLAAGQRQQISPYHVPESLVANVSHVDCFGCDQDRL